MKVAVDTDVLFLEQAHLLSGQCVRMRNQFLSPSRLSRWRWLSGFDDCAPSVRARGSYGGGCYLVTKFMERRFVENLNGLGHSRCFHLFFGIEVCHHRNLLGSTAR
jgi:hypothetical protein